MKRRKQTTSTRKTERLTGTHSVIKASLDFDSLLAIAWAHERIKSGGPLVQHSSAIVRRALRVYVRHLEQSEPRAEDRAVSNASKAFSVSEEDQRAAELRLYAEPLPSFDAVRHGAQAVAEREAMHARINQLMDQPTA